LVDLRTGRSGGCQNKPLSVLEIIDGFSGNSLPFHLQPLVEVPCLRRGEHIGHLLSAISGSASPCLGRSAEGYGLMRAGIAAAPSPPLGSASGSISQTLRSG